MAEEKDIIGREEPLNEDASTPETADEAADETPAAGPQGIKLLIAVKSLI